MVQIFIMIANNPRILFKKLHSCYAYFKFGNFLTHLFRTLILENDIASVAKPEILLI